MAGTCIATVKIIGVSSLGLLTTSLTYQSIKSIPLLINDLNNKITTFTSNNLVSIKSLIKKSRLINLTLSGLATSLFALAFRYSPLSEKHPYLIYAAVGGPLAVLSVFYKGYKYEEKMLRKPTIVDVKPKEESVPPAPTNDDDNESQLGKSYIHVSDEESSSTTSTPVSSMPNSPRIDSNDLTNDLTIEEEVENSLLKKEVVNDLKQIKSSYFVGSIISGFSFFISAVGLFGDYYLL